MPLELRILSRAEQDAQCIYDYIAERSPQGAADWWERFESAVRSAVLDPTAYALAPENHSTELELRQVIFKTRAGRRYRFVFVVVADQLRVLRVRGPGQPTLKNDEIDYS